MADLRVISDSFGMWSSVEPDDVDHTTVDPTPDLPKMPGQHRAEVAK